MVYKNRAAAGRLGLPRCGATDRFLRASDRNCTGAIGTRIAAVAILSSALQF
jgi:hypothetical protein